MQAPKEIHVQATKYLLRYLKRTIDHGLHLSCITNLSLLAFYDSDWAGDIEDRKSTGAYLIYMGSNAIS